ncbi:hypothetical protein DA798_08520 [Lactobacillus sp. PFC-70]|nr:hypothetical protein DA798_08520 [Lactobacillus sp. PFC-70]
MTKILPFLIDDNLSFRNFDKYSTDNDFKHILERNVEDNYFIKNFKKRILIFTNRTDFEIDSLGPNLIVAGVDYSRINIEDIREGKYRFTINVNQNGKTELIIKPQNSKNISIDAFNHIWFRHFGFFNSKKYTIEERYFTDEWNEFFNSVAEIYSSKMLTPSVEDNIYTKAYQLKIAGEIGLTIPDTAITNSLLRIKSMGNLYKKLLVKAVRHHSIYTFPNMIADFYSKTITTPIYPDENSSTKVPAIYQPDEYFDNSLKKEIRVSIFGSRVIAYEYVNTISDDWHNDDISGLSLKRIELPVSLNKMLLKLTKKLKLVFSTVDFIFDGHQWIFLEINPNGDWAWINNGRGKKLSKYVVSAILDL